MLKNNMYLNNKLIMLRQSEIDIGERKIENLLYGCKEFRRVRCPVLERFLRNVECMSECWKEDTFPPIVPEKLALDLTIIPSSRMMSGQLFSWTGPSLQVLVLAEKFLVSETNWGQYIVE